MGKILGPLKEAGLGGVEMASGDGVFRRCHPILAIFSGDYPEQVLVTGIKTGECPTCPVPRDELRSFEEMYEPRDLSAVLQALAKADGNATEFTRACESAGIKPIYHSFWEDLPFVNIFLSITPDVLHQLYQGVIKHVVAWIKEAFGPVEIDARCRRLPPNHNTRLFLKGITTLSRVSGTEHSQICRILLGLIVDLRLPGGQSTARLVRTVRASLDFLYHAQYPLHSSETLGLLNDDLQSFHDNKSVFIDLGIRDNFDLPKLHNISHYPLAIRLFGTIDNYNTEYTERLDIDFAKDAYRATNRKDEYLQMTLWPERKEKVLRHDKYIHFVQHRHLQMTKAPSAYGVKLAALTTKYELSKRQVENAAGDFFLPFQSVSVYRKITEFWNEDPLGREDAGDALDVVHVKPGYTNRQGRIIGGRFDTVIVNDGTGKHSGVQGYRVGQVQIVFALSDRVLGILFPGEKPAKHLATSASNASPPSSERVPSTLSMSDAFTWISPEGFDLARRIIRSTPVPYVPHDHQLEGVCKSLDGIDLFAITPTGSGKTSYYILYILIVLAVVNDPTLCPSAAFPQNPCLMMGFVHARMTGSHNPWILTSATVRDGAPFDNICKLLGLNNANFHLISFPELDWMLTSGRPSIIYAPDYGLGSRVYAYLCGISKSNNPNQIRMYNSLNFESHNAETRELLTGAPGEADSCQIVIGTDSLSVGVGMPARLDCVILYGDARHVKDADDFFQKLGRVGRTKGGSQRARGIIFVSAAARKLAQQTLDNYAAGILKDGENPPDLSMPTLIVALCKVAAQNKL
ncbi:hypothetical protein B0H11DRAFT_2264802 [Mycena galericulata]|nr:hypothetical protein B0H11DRAFT_2264802 [Mycena galericulata]